MGVKEGRKHTVRKLMEHEDTHQEFPLTLTML
jgi:hypothetical protein